MTGAVVCSLFRALTKWERLESERHAKKVAGRRKKEKRREIRLSWSLEQDMRFEVHVFTSLFTDPLSPLQSPSSAGDKI